jgi:hypothetical protein
VDIDLSIQRGADDHPPIATIVIAYSGAETVYPLRAGEDRLVQNFLAQVAFSPLNGAPVVA